jgi:hypothetical protein
MIKHFTWIVPLVIAGMIIVLRWASQFTAVATWLYRF